MDETRGSAPQAQSGRSRVEAAIERILEFHPKGYDLSLDRIRQLLGRLDNPQEKLPPVFHFAGTNGKGSTIAFSRAILENAGYTVHVHTSPHLVNWHERFRIGAPGGGRIAGDDELAEAIERVERANAGQQITLFELLTAAMFLLFSERAADFCLIEVGLGGRFDATNVISSPFLSVVTSISLDHREFLGDREELIAAEKAGIIKQGCPVVIGPQTDGVLGVLEETALKRNAPVFVANRDYQFYEQAGRLVYSDEAGLLDLPLPRLAGPYQQENAATAIAATRFCGLKIPESAFELAMQTAIWPGRMERLTRGPLLASIPRNVEIWVDGGHNQGASRVVASFLADLEERSPMPVFLVTGMLDTKDPAEYFASFAGIAEHVFAIPLPGTERFHPPRQIAEKAIGAGVPATACLSLEDAFKAIEGLLDNEEPARILLCGSLYLAGDILRRNLTPPS